MTVTKPVAAPAGTATAMLVALQLVGVATVAPNFTALVPWVVPKFVPTIVTFVPTGPEMAQSAQLFDISGDKMKLLLDFPTIGEPHYAQALPASLIKDKQLKFHELSKNTNPWVTHSESEGGIARTGKRVDVKMIAIRSHFAPDNLEDPVKMRDAVQTVTLLALRAVGVMDARARGLVVQQTLLPTTKALVGA